MTAKHTPLPLSFDGCGINGGDEYKTRIATFAKIRGADAAHYGPVFAAAPELLEACEAILKDAAILRRYQQITQDTADDEDTRFAQVIDGVRAAIAKAKGQQ